MKNKLLMKILATLVAGVSVFSFTGCSSCGDDKANDDDGTKVEKPNEEPPIDIGKDEHQHNYVYTDNDDGTHNGVCNGEGECNAKNITNEAHVWNNENKCEKCGTDKPDTTTHEHNYSAWAVDEDDETKHVRTCDVDGCDKPVESEDHVYDDGTDATCNRCPHVRDLGGEIPGHTHNYSKWTPDEDDETKHVRTCDVDGCDKPVERENHDYYDDEDASCDICGYKREIKKPDPPVIVNKELEGAVKIIKSSQSELEEAYVTWEIDENAKWYNVYVKATGTNNYTKLDAPLVRKYSTYFRADAVGLAKGTYDLKVVPVLTDGTEAEDKYSGEVTGINVKAHQRFGFGFLGGSASGAYNDDGTLRSGAQVFYITAETAKTVKATVTKKGKPVDATGFQSILDARESSQDSTPLCFRIVGTVTKSDLDHVSSSEEGLQIKSTGNITIEGIGSDGTIKDFGMLLRNDNNVEVRNLGILNCMDDGISIDTDNQHLWMHNNDIFYGAGGSGDKAKGDGALDTKGSTLITHSYNHFWDCGKCNLQGMKSEKEDYRITYHHNWYDHSDSRHPRIRTATVHIFNNYFDGNAKYGVGVTMGASAFVENNYFRSTTMMRPMMSSKQGTDILDDPEHKGTFSGEDGGIIKSFGNTYDSPNLKLRPYSADNTVEFDCYEASSRNEQVPASVKTKFGSTSYNNFDTASDFYKYEVESPEDAKENVQRYAGRVDGGDLQWTFNNEVDDKDYAVNSALKAAVTGYKTTVVAIGEGSAGSAGTGPVVKPDPIDPNPIDPNPVTPNPSSYKQTATFLTENEKYAKNGKIADGTSFTATVNKDVVVTKDISTAKADDATGMTFNYGLLPGGKDLAVTVKANEAITLTIYYTVSDSKFSTGDQAKEGNLSWKINGGATVDSTKTGKKDNKVAYSETITLEAGQEVVFTISKNRLVIFGIFAS